jgi:hypothetical protein
MVPDFEFTFQKLQPGSFFACEPMNTKRKKHEQDLKKTHFWLGNFNTKGHVVKCDLHELTRTLKQLGHTSPLFEVCSCRT